MHVTGFSWSVSDSIINCQCQLRFSFFVFGLLSYRFFVTFTVTFDFKSQVIVTLAYLSLRNAPWSEGGCLSPAKLRSTDSVNPRAVISRVRPRYRPVL
jgi:hypothetical protein